MQMLYNSDNFAVVLIDVPGNDAQGAPVSRGGYEIVDKYARKGIFLDGALAESFKDGVQALIDGAPSTEAFDEYIGRYASLMSQPVVLH